MPDVSVVIVSWNARDHLLKCLQSLRDTAPKELSIEIIVVDNASSDGSPESVRREFPEVNLVETGANLGFAGGNNEGIRRATGRYLCLVNSDVVVFEGCLQNLVAFMDAHPRTGMAGPRVLNRDGSLQPSCSRPWSLWTRFCAATALDRLARNHPLFADTLMTEWKHDSVRTVSALSGCFWIVRSEAVKQVGGLDQDFFMYGEDFDWCQRFRDAGWDILFVPSSEIIHFGGASSSSVPLKSFVQMHKSAYCLWRKYHGRLSTFCFQVLALLHHGARLIAWILLFVLIPSRRNDKTRLKIRQYSTCARWFCRPRLEP